MTEIKWILVENVPCNSEDTLLRFYLCYEQIWTETYATLFNTEGVTDLWNKNDVVQLNKKSFKFDVGIAGNRNGYLCEVYKWFTVFFQTFYAPLLFFWDWVSLGSPGWPHTHGLLASTTQVLGLQTSGTIPCSITYIYNNISRLSMEKRTLLFSLHRSIIKFHEAIRLKLF
jgi:hypothetical protein